MFQVILTVCALAGAGDTPDAAMCQTFPMPHVFRDEATCKATADQLDMRLSTNVPGEEITEGEAICKPKDNATP